MLNLAFVARSRSRAIYADRLGRAHASRRALADAGRSADREIGRWLMARPEPHVLRLFQRDGNIIRLRLMLLLLASVGISVTSVLFWCLVVLLCVPSSRLDRRHRRAEAQHLHDCRRGFRCDHRVAAGADLPSATGLAVYYIVNFRYCQLSLQQRSPMCWQNPLDAWPV